MAGSIEVHPYDPVMFFLSAQLGDPALTNLLLLRPDVKERQDGKLKVFKSFQMWGVGILSAKLDYHQVADTMRNKPMPGQHCAQSPNTESEFFTHFHKFT